MRMTTEEAFVKVLQRHGLEHAFGIIGSAFMPVSDLFPKAGITFWDAAHESNAGLICDGFTRATGKMAMAIAQNGPGVTGFVTAVKTAYWNHTPMLLVTPQAANRTIGQGGFQEVEQMALFRDMVCYQEEVRDASRMAEVLNRVILKAKRLSAPAQINVPRDFWTQVIDIELPAIVEFERPAGGAEAIAEAARLLSSARFPVILSGAGVVIGGAIADCVALAERIDAPVVLRLSAQRQLSGSPSAGGGAARLQRLQGGDGADRPGRCGPGPRHAAQSLLHAARLRDRLLAAGREDHPGRHQRRPDRSDQAGQRRDLRRRAAGGRGRSSRSSRLPPATPAAKNAGALIHTTKSAWSQALSSIDHEDDDPGTSWNGRARDREPDHMSPRQAWRAIQAALPARRHHFQRYRQQLRDRQRLSELRRRAENTSRQACSAHAATAFRPSSAPRSAAPTRRWSASPVTAPSASP